MDCREQNLDLIDDLLKARSEHTQWLTAVTAETTEAARTTLPSGYSSLEIGTWISDNKKTLQHFGLLADFEHCHGQLINGYSAILKNGNSHLLTAKIRLVSTQLFEMLDNLEKLLQKRSKMIH